MDNQGLAMVGAFLILNFSLGNSAEKIPYTRAAFYTHGQVIMDLKINTYNCYVNCERSNVKMKNRFHVSRDNNVCMT